MTNGTTVRGYDPVTGEELWQLGPNSEVTVATPVIAEGRSYVTANLNGNEAIPFDPETATFTSRRSGSSDLLMVPIDGGEVRPLVATEADERSGAWRP